ncbi:hypothetical protein DPM33_00140 [Mesorhizobium hawassense]|uniref:RelA/SpoT domain-containing protein n=1 Tax=Mesorhizobium hawassense TaxID=1209954 RepID=A0A330HVC5_9HYPH|nr:RelA/SpoT domain-containing protein [Mesorhizobium hawassense]RAZ92375.1 hypothetical protein DPM33_00140 [Mesorhizobium hawassense]
MSQYPRLEYSMEDVRAAGKSLAGPVSFTPQNNAVAVEIFSIANSWRDSHIYPMRSIRASVRIAMRQAYIRGDMAARPKRMSSIRRKLADTTIRLDQMQDLGGCRAILNDIDGVNRLVERVRERSQHCIRKEWNYIQNPKGDGYRSHHLSMEFTPARKEDESFAGRRIELQLRTRLQHSWATAIEAVSLYRNQDLKHHKADGDWLRLFELASAEFAQVERSPLPTGVPDQAERVKELKDLNARLGAVSMLENIKAATHFAENFTHDRGRYYLLRYRPDHTVKIETYTGTFSATSALELAERAIEAGESQDKVVLVEVDKIDKLVSTYPNYFGDVSLFIRNLQLACGGKSGIEYTVAPQEVVRPREVQQPDYGALRRRYTRWIEPRR